MLRNRGEIATFVAVLTTAMTINNLKYTMKLLSLRLAAFAAAALCLFVTATGKELTATSPDGAIALSVGTDGNRPVYSVNYHGTPVVRPSHLGFIINGTTLGDNMKMKAHRLAGHDDTWWQPWGEEDSIRNHYNELAVDFVEKGKAGRAMTVVFRLFDDGLGFRYIIAGQRTAVSDRRRAHRDTPCPRRRGVVDTHQPHRIFRRHLRARPSEPQGHGVHAAHGGV